MSARIHAERLRRKAHQVEDNQDSVWLSAEGQSVVREDSVSNEVSERKKGVQLTEQRDTEGYERIYSFLKIEIVVVVRARSKERGGGLC